MDNLILTNTLTKKKDDFVPAKKNKLNLYACGITPYDYSHIGHGRSYVFIDTIVRFFRFCGYDVTYVRNITDIDDKLLRKAEASGDISTYKTLAEHFVKNYHEEMAALNNLSPDYEPKVTENIPLIIEFIDGLIKNKKAYVIDGDVYFDVTSYEKYGELSGKKLEDLQAGARVAVDTRKKNPADFALWKSEDREKTDIFWDAPWGYGRPGWHIECSALAKKFFGETIDIHCGGMDLVFPHHENERAQSEALHNKTFVRCWVHNALLNIDKEKMSKSLGNILSLKEIFEKYDPMVLRYYFLQHHYRTPIEFSFDNLKSAQVAYKKLAKIFGPVDLDDERKKSSIEDFAKDSCLKEMIDALTDDLNTPKVLGILFKNIEKISTDQTRLVLVKKFLNDVLGLQFFSPEEFFITPEMSALIEKRKEARENKDWALADSIRDELRQLGYEVQDKKL